MILMAFGNIFGQGGSSLISRLLGQERRADVRRVSAFCFWIALLVGAAVGGILLLLREPFLRLLGASADTLPYAREYGTVLLLGAPFIVVNFIHMNLLRCDGMPAFSMLGTLLGAVVNVILDPLLISVMGAAGAALATVIGYISSDLLLLVIVLTRSKTLSVRPLLKTEGVFLKDIISIGITAAITNIASSICTVLLNQKLLPFGDDKIAAMGIVLKVTMIVQMILVGFSFGGVPLFGFLAGAGARDKVRRLYRFCALFLRAVSDRPGSSDDTARRPAGALAAWPDHAGHGSCRSCGPNAPARPNKALFLSLSRQGVVFAAILLLLSALFGYWGILSAQCAADVLSAGIAGWILLKGKVLKTT